MKYIFSLHNHSTFSNDKFMRRETPDKILNQILKDKIYVISITDAREDIFFDYIINKRNDYAHICTVEKISNSVILLDYGNWESYLIRGMEKHDCEGHMLIIGTDSRIEYNDSYTINDWIDYANDNGGICGPAHPIEQFVGGMGVDVLLKHIHKFDFIEIFNAQLVFNKNANVAAELLSDKFNVPGIATSDSHNHKNLIKSYFYTEKKENISVQSVKNIIKNKRFTNFKRYITYRELFMTYIIRRL
ncbi:PHP domain-containing protein [candidate division WOR-3 bacterium]|nr:PHP domain-containing protein [candidate division WOR-3 bacterium]